MIWSDLSTVQYSGMDPLSLDGWITGWVRHFVTTVASFLAVAALSGCGQGSAYHHYRGEAMGTQLALTHAGCDGDVEAAVVHELQQVDAQLSTWRPDSEVARFNASAAGEWFPVSARVAGLAVEALALSRRSGGAFDLTVAPLVQLWGFGPQAPVGESVPGAEAIAVAMQRVGWQQLEARLDPPALRKRFDGLSLDFSAIGKGHGVDRVAVRLDGLGCHSYLVDIGGEVRTRGRNSTGQPWRIGVEQPDGGPPQWVLRLSGQSAATSGDYRNFRLLGGRRLSHAIDPPRRGAGQPCLGLGDGGGGQRRRKRTAWRQPSRCSAPMKAGTSPAARAWPPCCWCAAKVASSAAILNP